MAFPVKPKTNFPSNVPLSETLFLLRSVLIDNIFKLEPLPDAENQTAQQLARIAQTLSHSATNEPTAYDNGLVRTSATSSAGLLERQVERALSQVLGRSPGRGPAGFINALNGAFPAGANGQVVFKPTRSIVSLYSSNGNGNSSTSWEMNGTALAGQLSVEQANLYRQASIIAVDAIRVLEGLQPFDPTSDLDAVEALRALIRSQINTLVEEFGRLDEPRKERVEAYLSTLLVKSSSSGGSSLVGGSLFEFGVQARFLIGNLSLPVTPVTLDDETHLAGFDLLVNYVETLNSIWVRFKGTTLSEAASNRYSERLSRASILLPVIADSNANLMAAMDSIGFSESERRSDAALFTSLALGMPLRKFLLSIDDIALNPCAVDVVRQIFGQPVGCRGPFIDKVSLPDITVNDLNEWIDRFTTVEAPSILASSGQFGLNFVTDQADTLFWVIGFVLDFIKANQNGDRITLLEQILTFERVQQTFGELAFQLKTLADLSLPVLPPVPAPVPAPAPAPTPAPTQRLFPHQ